MALLTSLQKVALRILFCSDVSNRREAWPLSRADTDAAVDATDSWIDSNAPSYNNALPTAAKNGLNATQKAALFSAVAAKRYGG